MMDDNNKNNLPLEGFDSVTRGFIIGAEDSEPNAPTNAEVSEEPTLEPIPPKNPLPQNEHKKKSYSFAAVLTAVILSAAIGAASAFGAFVLLKDDTATVSPTPSGDNIVNTTINVDKVADSVIEAVAEKASPSVVGIRTTAAVYNFFGGVSDSQGEGSGVIYKSDGYIITNYHVIESVVGQSAANAKIEVFLSQNSAESYPATIIGYNISSDLAVIKIEKQGLPAITLGNSDELKAGQFVAAIGCPGGLNFMGSVSYGIVSGLNRQLASGDTGAVSLIQTDAAINPGNSGGALLNIKGELVGINSSKIASTEYEGMGFAIPVNSVKEICNQIIAREDNPEPYIGITISETYDKQTLIGLGYPAGAVVSSVVTGGPASESGIRRGDIITEFAGKEIANYSDLYDVISAQKVGSKVSVKIYRSGRYYTTDITILSNNSF